MNTLTVQREEPPPLEHPLPPCSICGESTDYDGGFYCTPCGASWDSELSHLNGHSRWDNAEASQCAAAEQPWAKQERYPSLRGLTFRCLLDDKHDGPHRNPEHPEHSWETANASP